MTAVETWVSPYTSVPRRVPRAGPARHRQRLACAAIFALGPTALFWWWFATAVVDRMGSQPSTMRWAIPTAALWVSLSPLLMQQAEFRLENLLREFSRHGGRAGWDLGAIQRCVDSWDRAFYLLVLPVGLAPLVALALSFEPLDAVIPVHHGWHRAAGLVVIGAVGLCSAAGIWGISKAIALVYAATKGARLHWTPFRTERAWGIRQLYTFAWVEGLMFSCGALFVPAMLGVQPQLTPASRAIVWVFVVLLFGGGLTVFSIPVWLLYRLSRESQERALDTFAPAIEDAVRVVTAPGNSAHPLIEREWSRLDVALRLRQVIVTTEPAPFSFGYIGRAATTLLLPIALTVVQVVTSR
ncbi:hypothetical protein OG792_13585 [Micromonospora sp. NBC_01699]|uniref:hypothetical protein n=1 Tax=Micromonospora sp. NBC_01699 TaxID=2975984 RepID=UPI002E3196EB|nr:hypothetical protein [Micromonospora sp. NBC_01699]